MLYEKPKKYKILIYNKSSKVHQPYFLADPNVKVKHLFEHGFQICCAGVGVYITIFFNCLSQKNRFLDNSIWNYSVENFLEEWGAGFAPAPRGSVIQIFVTL
jgi:hypothetical protein